MNKEKQKRQIDLFLSEKGSKEVDAFCVYQWIERCHFQEWWDRAVKLAPKIAPNSLDQHYHKRLDFLLSECRTNLDRINQECVPIRNSSGDPQFFVPRSFIMACINLELRPFGTTSKGVAFESDGRRVLFIEEISPKKCTFRLDNMEPETLSSWLRSHGFDHLVHEIIWPSGQGDPQPGRLRITWPDASNLIDSLIPHLKEKFPAYRPASFPRAPIETSSFAPSGRRIQFGITAIHTLRAYNVITFPPGHRRFFPGYKIPFIFQTDIGEIETHVSSGTQKAQQGDPDEGKYIARNLKPWIRRHFKEIEAGNLITIESIEPGRTYRLSVNR